MNPKRQEQELAECVMAESWYWCAAGLALAVPLGVRFHTYTPLVYLGMGGTAIDLVQGYNACQRQRDALRQAQETAHVR